MGEGSALHRGPRVRGLRATALGRTQISTPLLWSSATVWVFQNGQPRGPTLSSGLC